MKIIIPIDPKTGKPRKGKWVDKNWIPESGIVHLTKPQSNDDFKVEPWVWGFGKKQQEVR